MYVKSISISCNFNAKTSPILIPVKRNNNKIMHSVAKNIFAAEPIPLKKILLTNFYFMVLIFFKTTKGLIKKLILAL